MSRTKRLVFVAVVAGLVLTSSVILWRMRSQARVAARERAGMVFRSPVDVGTSMKAIQQRFGAPTRIESRTSYGVEQWRCGADSTQRLTYDSDAIWVTIYFDRGGRVACVERGAYVR